MAENDYYTPSPANRTPWWGRWWMIVSWTLLLAVVLILPLCVFAIIAADECPNSEEQVYFVELRAAMTLMEEAMNEMPMPELTVGEIWHSDPELDMQVAQAQDMIWGAIDEINAARAPENLQSIDRDYKRVAVEMSAAIDNYAAWVATHDLDLLEESTRHLGEAGLILDEANSKVRNFCD